jgi:hypothetical protein
VRHDADVPRLVQRYLPGHFKPFYVLRSACDVQSFQRSGFQVFVPRFALRSRSHR